MESNGTKDIEKISSLEEVKIITQKEDDDSKKIEDLNTLISEYKSMNKFIPKFERF